MSVRENLKAIDEALARAQRKNMKRMTLVVEAYEPLRTQLVEAIEAGEQLARTEERKRTADRKKAEFQSKMKKEDDDLYLAAELAERAFRPRRASVIEAPKKKTKLERIDNRVERLRRALDACHESSLPARKRLWTTGSLDYVETGSDIDEPPAWFSEEDL